MSSPIFCDEVAGISVREPPLFRPGVLNEDMGWIKCSEQHYYSYATCLFPGFSIARQMMSKYMLASKVSASFFFRYSHM